MKEQPRFSDIQFGPIRHPVLPRDFIKRIKAFKKILGDIDSIPIEQTIDNFKRDADPEGELVIWERIASTFQLYLSHKPTTDLAIRKGIFAVLLGASMGINDVVVEELVHATPHSGTSLAGKSHELGRCSMLRGGD